MGLSHGDGSRVEFWSSFLTVPTHWGHSELRPGSAFVTLGFYFLIAEKIMVGTWEQCGQGSAKSLHLGLGLSSQLCRRSTSHLTLGLLLFLPGVGGWGSGVRRCLNWGPRVLLGSRWFL